jgi:hypothetical protein
MRLPIGALLVKADEDHWTTQGANALRELIIREETTDLFECLRMALGR